jgi:hypothetical protein
MPIIPIPFPAIQGVRTDHSSLQFMINGVPIFPGASNLMKYGLASWNWDSGLNPMPLKGAASQPVGYTRGEYEGTGDMEWWRADGDNLEQFLINEFAGQGLYEGWFLMQGFVNEPSLSLPSTIMMWARIKHRASDSKPGEPHKKKYPLLLASVMENGIKEFSGQVFPGITGF